LLDSTFFQACETAAAEWDVPALAVGASVGGRVETLSVGCPVDTRFRIASITKPFTATLALQLLDPEAVTGVWPEDIRVRHLLSHTSGYHSEWGDLARFGDDDTALAGLVAELPGIRRYVAAEQAWSYANSGYWLAGWLAAEQAGQPYEDALAERVLRPAALESTSFGEPDVAGTGRDAAAGPYPRARRPSGGLVSNVADLLRFGDWHLQQPQSERLRSVHGKPPAGVYGLGLFGERVGGIPVWGHGGSYGGFQTSLLVIPERDAVFVGLTNSSAGEHALEVLEDEFFERLVGARRRVPEPVDLPAAALGGFAGTYETADERIHVGAVPGGLVVRLDEGESHTEFHAVPIGPSTFEITDGDWIRARFDFPIPGFGRFGNCLAERVA
jgi:CubicO group peptidase (beta-lactamase class C family)